MFTRRAKNSWTVNLGLSIRVGWLNQVHNRFPQCSNSKKQVTCVFVESNLGSRALGGRRAIKRTHAVGIGWRGKGQSSQKPAFSSVAEGSQDVRHSEPARL